MQDAERTNNTIPGVSVSARPGEFNINPFAGPLGRIPAETTQESAPSLSGTFWQGQDGNVYVAGNDGVNNAGRWDDNTMSYWTERGFAHIPDPNPGRTTTTTTAGGASGNLPVLDTAAISAANAELGQIPGLRDAALKADKQRFDNIMGRFNTQEQEQRRQFDEGITRNQQNYDSNLMASLRAGASGIRNLMALLRGAGGTAVERARDTVGDVTSEDIRAGYDTNRENTDALTGSLNTFLGELEGRRDETRDTFENNQRATRAGFAENERAIYERLAEIYAGAGDTAQALHWANKATELVPVIARDSRTQVSPYVARDIRVQAPEITAFRGPSTPSVNQVDNGRGRIAPGIFTISDDTRRRLAGAEA